MSVSHACVCECVAGFVVLLMLICVFTAGLQLPCESVFRCCLNCSKSLSSLSYFQLNDNLYELYFVYRSSCTPSNEIEVLLCSFCLSSWVMCSVLSIALSKQQSKLLRYTVYLYRNVYIHLMNILTWLYPVEIQAETCWLFCISIFVDAYSCIFNPELHRLPSCELC